MTIGLIPSRKWLQLQRLAEPLLNHVIGSLAPVYILLTLCTLLSCAVCDCHYFSSEIE